MTDQTAPSAPRDNLFGVCHAIGETFGFNPLYLRLAFLLVVMVNAQIALGAYFVGGIAVLAAKLATRRGARTASKRTLTLTHA